MNRFPATITPIGWKEFNTKTSAETRMLFSRSEKSWQGSDDLGTQIYQKIKVFIKELARTDQTPSQTFQFVSMCADGEAHE